VANCLLGAGSKSKNDGSEINPHHLAKQAAVSPSGPPPVLAELRETAALNNHDADMLSPSRRRGGNER